MKQSGELLQFIRISHNISVIDMAAALGTTPEELRHIENDDGNVPVEWLQHIYDNFELSPEEQYILSYYVDTHSSDDNVITHSYKGYTVIVRGRHSLSIIDNEYGNTVLRTCSRTKKDMTIADMEAVVETYLLLIQIDDEEESLQ